MDPLLDPLLDPLGAILSKGSDSDAAELEVAEARDDNPPFLAFGTGITISASAAIKRGLFGPSK